MVGKISVWLFVFASLLSGQAPSLSVTADSSSYLIGDYIHVNVKLSLPRTANSILPPPAELFKPLEFIREEKRDTAQTDGNVVISTRLIYAAFDSGYKVIEPLRLQFHMPGDTAARTLQSDTLRLFIAALPVDTAKDIRDLKPPAREPLDWLFILLMVLLAACLIAGIVYYLKKRKSKLEAIPKPEVLLPPDVLAVKELDALEEKQLWQQGFIKEYHSEITGIVRTFFERQLGFPSLELTSRETMTELLNMELSGEVINAAESFFTNADMVKFAKFQPIPKINSEMMTQAREMVRLVCLQSPKVGELVK